MLQGYKKQTKQIQSNTWTQMQQFLREYQQIESNHIKRILHNDSVEFSPECKACLTFENQAT